MSVALIFIEIAPDFKIEILRKQLQYVKIINFGCKKNNVCLKAQEG